MAKKKKSSSSSSSSSSGNYTMVIRLTAFIALILTATLTLLSWIFGLFDASLGKIGSIMNNIADIAFIIAIGFGAWDFVARKRMIWRIVFAAALIILLVFKVLGWFNF